MFEIDQDQFLFLSGVSPLTEELANAANQVLSESLKVQRLLRKATGLSFKPIKNTVRLTESMVGLRFTHNTEWSGVGSEFMVVLEYKDNTQTFDLTAILSESHGCFGQYTPFTPKILSKHEIRGLKPEALSDVKTLLLPMFPEVSTKKSTESSEDRHSRLIEESTKARGRKLTKTKK